jgi:hypothetical protein
MFVPPDGSGAADDLPIDNAPDTTHTVYLVGANQAHFIPAPFACG